MALPLSRDRRTMPQEYLILIHKQLLVIDDNHNWLHPSADFLGLPSTAIEKKLILQKNGQRVIKVAEISARLHDSQLLNFRAIAGQVDAQEGILISRALQLVTWQKQHRYCGQCGRLNSEHPHDQALVCEPCHLTHYPKISPCIMCLITRGDSCLLAHHQRHPDGLYSTLAGFVEAGENLEQTLHREVFEEVGLTVKALRYFSSQSWPFPHQLMVGYFAEYDRGEIQVDQCEIEDARWFHYTNLPQIPVDTTLSGQLIRAFVEARTTRTRQHNQRVHQ